MVRHSRRALDWRLWCGSRQIAVGGHGSALPVRPGLAAMVRYTRIQVEPSHARLLFVAGSRWPDPDVARRPPAPPTRRPSGGIRRRPITALVRGCRAWLGTTGARRIAVGGHGSALPVRPGLPAMVRCTRIPVEPSHARLLFVAGSRWPDPDVGRRSGARPTRCLSGGIRLRTVAALARGCRARLGTTGARRVLAARSIRPWVSAPASASPSAAANRHRPASRSPHWPRHGYPARPRPATLR